MNKREIQVVYAESYLSRLMGLMGLMRWPKTHRGLYFPRCSSVHTFFTFLSPDILFLDKSNKIIKIFHRTKSWRVFWGPVRTFNCLELPNGTARDLDLKVGDLLNCWKRNDDKS